MKQTNGILDNTEAAAKKSVQSKLKKSDAEFKWRGLTKVLCRVKEALTWLIIPKTTAYGDDDNWDLLAEMAGRPGEKQTFNRGPSSVESERNVTEAEGMSNWTLVFDIDGEARSVWSAVSAGKGSSVMKL